MTLVTNEIHLLDGFRRTILVFAADRRLTDYRDGSFAGIGQKLFRIPYLEAGVSYFGLATYRNRGGEFRMTDWLRNFIRRAHATRTIRDFALRLRNDLNATIPRSVLSQRASGFHICGYNGEGLPDFWYLTNIGGMDNFQYNRFAPEYAEPSRDFLDRDARDSLGWNGTDLTSVRSEIWIYRNGDYRPHSLLWDRLGAFIDGMSQTPNFAALRRTTTENYERIARFKLGVIAHFYRKFGRSQTIGTPIDVFCLSKRL